ncbi:Hypothetical protein IALB_0447 [Ignavibacterium album JCM 16511]|uniref:Uncharacterized protein n=1 Tax=Ignavibacterium album (strain DSM 19864 / JCM 16511 / NBRC 101810 / Mat9-16) TaxID=945713 RepID=I0AFU5_IGNAJ|nr:Hypothetical protein IALB_0140 [Ignavibacterium album JCM 16511]AFH48159.1 Hypothetical protein IALB_0447 [Ignavibacterium album JCM 16511]
MILKVPSPYAKHPVEEKGFRDEAYLITIIFLLETKEPAVSLSVCYIN